MNALNYLIFILAYFLYFGILALPYFKPAGRKTWEALIPVYNVYRMTQIIERPWWWVILAFLPVVGNVMMLVIFYEILHVYRKGSFKNIFIVALTAGLYFAYLGWGEKLVYQGRDIKEIRKHISELAASIIFAVVAASAIRAFTFEAFTIPTPSMEKSLMVGDFLFVSKMHYGVRVPMTPLSLPLLHNRIPGTQVNSYVEWIQLPYLRIPGWEEVKRNDPIVFNYPAEDIRPINMKGELRPIDKREHYVKRVIGMPGDTFRIAEGMVYINGEKNTLPPRAHKQMSYQVLTTGVGLSARQLKEKLNIDYEQAVKFQRRFQQGGQPAILYLMDIPDEQLAEFQKLPNVSRIEPYFQPPTLENPVFPNPFHLDSLYFPWSADNYGPLYIPAKGASIVLNEKNYHTYRRVIEFYEGQQSFERKGDDYYLNGEKIDRYEFKQDYYFMLGDNRHSSDDSRYWGFVPHDHIVGKPVFIWMSFDKFGEGLANKIRTERVFTTVSGTGKRQSYFWPFVGIALLLYLGNRYRKKRKAAQA